MSHVKKRMKDEKLDGCCITSWSLLALSWKKTSLTSWEEDPGQARDVQQTVFLRTEVYAYVPDINLKHADCSSEFQGIIEGVCIHATGSQETETPDLAVYHRLAGG